MVVMAKALWSGHSPVGSTIHGKLAVLAPLQPKRSQARAEACRARWDPIIGPEAAEQRYRADTARIMAWRFSLGMVISIVVAIASPTPVVAHISAYCFVVTAIITVFFEALFLQRRALQNEAASAFLRIRVTSRNFPPWNPEQYKAWRAKHHVTHGR